MAGHAVEVTWNTFLPTPSISIYANPTGTEARGPRAARSSEPEGRRLQSSPSRYSAFSAFKAQFARFHKASTTPELAKAWAPLDSLWTLSGLSLPLRLVSLVDQISWRDGLPIPNGPHCPRLRPRNSGSPPRLKKSKIFLEEDCSIRLLTGPWPGEAAPLAPLSEALKREANLTVGALSKKQDMEESVRRKHFASREHTELIGPSLGRPRRRRLL